MVTVSPSGAHSEPAAAAAKQDGSRLAFVEQAVRTRSPAPPYEPVQEARPVKAPRTSAPLDLLPKLTPAVPLRSRPTRFWASQVCVWPLLCCGPALFAQISLQRPERWGGR
jgi:hypothetical protein